MHVCTSLAPAGKINLANSGFGLRLHCFHRSMKNVVKLETYYYLWELEQAIADWVQYYNPERCYESLVNVTPADVYRGRKEQILDQRAIIKSRSMNHKKGRNMWFAG